ncbi:transcription factor IIA [Drepanopeziza brunnea f. sp. 'multigermtubi' MB_m1]|uniref:Transcription initiation factor IIA large subunit n=1 Tax=Marssonina brunnea f. sp. multigermtubi (strain MB_m1) TaxID=1072389 RepID=K1WU29_MARBU|nr:transcription factor IIA [Drepanopeziza brunnea f. sp. 'multigermtubi' MB_m1]EKD12083.1 transcription factor IIA [Drepanopeziza brunnea f. sp. 'multigermtubi' MB_m1]
MSNTQVGNVYQTIINDVIESSSVDFEEGGVDDRVLEELRRGWQSKLSQLQVAQFPWDPKPEPAPVINNPPTVPSNAGYQAQNSPAPQSQGLTMPQQQPPQQPPQQPQQQPQHQGVPPQVNNGPRIKTEPGLEGQGLSMPQAPFQSQPPLNHPNHTTTAQQRAAQSLHSSYGPRAAASINAIHNGPQGQSNMSQGQSNMSQGQSNMSQGQSNMSQPQQRAMQAPQQQNGQNINMQQMSAAQQAQYQQQRNQAMMHAQNMQQQQQQQQQGNQIPTTQAPGQFKQMNAQNQARQMMGQNQGVQQQQQQQQQQRNMQNGGLGNAQTDGAGDEVETLSVIKRFSPSGEEISMGRIEIDGLIREKIEAMGSSMEGGGLMLPLHKASTSAKRQRRVAKSKSAVAAQMDGGDDDDNKDGGNGELDEDAINSDLDDPDEGDNEEEDDDESMGHIMLCMYDKVQRVKNKWKCVMKDGVLTVNGKEYVFHKASGEYEW